jgi:DNA polymerase elongation subunit (family B)
MKEYNMEPIETSPIIVNLDFASLYPQLQKAYNITPIPRIIRRKNKIKKIFNL